MVFVLPELSYDYDALEPHLSAETLHIHHGKHHRAYIDALNGVVRDFIREVPPERQSLEAIVRASANAAGSDVLFNAAAQAWNHAFYWKCLAPTGGGRPSGEVAAQIDADFGSYDAFARQFKATATAQFGSGWAWLVHTGTSLAITSTSNADTPIAKGQTPLLTIDVWEHAYYVDYRNRRADYVAAYLDNLVDWDFANANLGRCVEREPSVHRLRA